MRLAIIIPRFGIEISGGAERLARGFASEALRRGWQTEVWTTCARRHETWKNTLPSGRDRVDGIPVLRFPVSFYNRDNRRSLEAKITTQGKLPLEDQFAWLESGPHSITLYQQVKHAAPDYDLIVALPYANPLVHYAAWLAPERVLLWPCLHNEPYAYMQPVRLLMASVWAVAFNAPEEASLANDGLNLDLARSAILGAGVTSLGAQQTNGSGSVRKDIADPYLVYAGRLESGKNLDQLYSFVKRYNQRDPQSKLNLVVTGQGQLSPPELPFFDFRGFVSDAELAQIMAESLALCQPSYYESFSLTTMEAWLSGRPALVSGRSAVTRGHVIRSKGGLWFESFDEFASAVDWLVANPDKATRMGQNGRRYVQQNYTWPLVLDRFENAYRSWQKIVDQEPI